MSGGHQANADLILLGVGRAQHRKKWCLPSSCVGGLNTGTMVAVSLALALKPYSLFLPVYLWHPLSYCPFTRAKCLIVNVSGFPATFHLTWMNGIPDDFHSQML